MDAKLDVTNVVLFMLVVFPGMISINVYRVLMPARPLDWTTALLQGLFYSAVNFALGWPIPYLLLFGRDPLEHPVRYFVAAFLVLIVLPMLWPFVVAAAIRSRRFRQWIRYPTAWDFFFDRRSATLVLVHMNKWRTSRWTMGTGLVRRIIPERRGHLPGRGLQDGRG